MHGEATQQTTFLPEPPPFDTERFYELQVRRGCERYDEGDPGFLTADECRAEYFEEALNTAQFIRQMQSELANVGDEKRSKKQEKELEEKALRLRWELTTIGVYLIETEIYFGTQNAEYLRLWLRETAGFEFDEQYKPVPTQQRGLFE